METYPLKPDKPSKTWGNDASSHLMRVKFWLSN